MSVEKNRESYWSFLFGCFFVCCVVVYACDWWMKVPEPKVKYKMSYRQMRVFEGFAGCQDVKQYLTELIYHLKVVSDNFELSYFCKNLIVTGFDDLCEWMALPSDQRISYLNSLPPESSGHMLIKVMFYDKVADYNKEWERRAVAEIRRECFSIALYNITTRREVAKKIDEILSKYEKIDKDGSQ